MDDRSAVKALAHPTRVRILRYLQEHETASAVELAVEFALPLGTVAYHVRRLEALGFARIANVVLRRGAVEHRYQLQDQLELEEAIKSIGRDLLSPQGKGRAELRATLDAAAIAELRLSLVELLPRLEVETATRARVEREAHSFVVDVVFSSRSPSRVAARRRR
jgi:DNA-binding transcriptional ArsR family regulator